MDISRKWHIKSGERKREQVELRHGHSTEGRRDELDSAECGISEDLHSIFLKNTQRARA